MNRSLFAVLLALAACVAAVMIASRGTASHRDLGGAEPAFGSGDAPEGRRGRPPGSAELAAPPAEGRAAHRASSDAAGRPGPDAGAPAAGGGIEVRCTDARTGEPVAGAEVRFLGRSGFGVESFAQKDDLPPDARERILAAGGARACDARGRTRVPRPVERTLLLACAGEREGWAALETFDLGPVGIPLGPPRELVARVLDAEGRPAAGVPVEAGWSATYYGRRDQRWTARASTDEAGEARFDWGPFAAGEHARRATHGAVRAALAIPGRPVARVAREGPPDEPLELRLPPTGRLVVELLDVAGALRGGLHLIHLQCSGPDGRSAGASAVARAGRAVFERVALGTRFRVWVAGDRFAESEPGLVEGPVAAGEEVVARLRLLSDACVVRGALALPDGSPLRDGEARVHLAESEPAGFLPFAPRLRTDGEGAFSLALPHEPSLEVPRAVEIRPEAEGCARQSARATLPALAPGAVVDLGTLWLAESTPAVAGAVIDADASPIPGAWVRYSVLGRDGEGAACIVAFDERPTDREGRFAFAALQLPSGEGAPVTSDPAHRVEARAEGFAPSEPRPCRPGDREVAIELRRFGRIHGRLLVDEELRGEVFPAFVLEGAFDHERSGRGEPDAGGWFGLVGVRPGVGDVIVTTDDPNPPVLHRVPGVVVPEGGVAKDPRLDPIDLRGMLRTLRISLVHHAGEPIRYGEVRVLVEGADEPANATLRDGSLRLVVPPGPVDVELLPYPDAAAVRLLGLAADVEVTTVPRPTVELVVHGGEGKVLPRLAARFDRVRDLPLAIPMREHVGPIEPCQPRTADLPASGAWTVQLLAVGGEPPRNHEIGAPRRIEVLPSGAGPQRVELELEVAAIPEDLRADAPAAD